MKKISKKAVAIVEKYNDIDEIVGEEWKQVEKQINKLFLDFTHDCDIWDIKITEKYSGQYQQDGQYCSQSSIGYDGDCFRGTYYFPTTDGRYLAVSYDI